MTLSQARAKARELHAAVREGKDPLAGRKADKVRADADAAKGEAVDKTFAEVADIRLARSRMAQP
jgi:hypothetical protein